MGKILNALKTADGEVSDLVLRCLNDDDYAVLAAPPADVLPIAGRRTSPAAVIEPIFDKAPVTQLGFEDEGGEQQDWPEGSALLKRCRDDEREFRFVSLRISDTAPLLSANGDDRRAAEQYRIIRTKIFHQVSGSSITVISSPGVGDGKTVTSLNLASALALKSEDKVILVDADLRLSKVHERLGIAKGPGLAEVLSGACTLGEAAVRVEQLPNFYILPAGEAHSNPSELIDSANWRTLMARLREDFKRTIIDSPPMEAVADYDLIAASCDGVVLVVRPDHTSRPLLNRALARVKGKLTGVLINDAEDWFLWKRSSPNYHYYMNPSLAKRAAKGSK